PFGWSELLGTGEGWGSNESRLSLLGTAFCFRVEEFSDAVINHFNNGRAPAWIRLQHDIRWLDVAMHNAALFRGGQRARGLFAYFKRLRERHGAVAANPRFEGFAFDQLHHIET